MRHGPASGDAPPHHRLHHCAGRLHTPARPPSSPNLASQGTDEPAPVCHAMDPASLHPARRNDALVPPDGVPPQASVRPSPDAARLFPHRLLHPTTVMATRSIRKNWFATCCVGSSRTRPSTVQQHHGHFPADHGGVDRRWRGLRWRRNTLCSIKMNDGTYLTTGIWFLFLLCF